MYKTKGVDAITSITALRQETGTLLNKVKSGTRSIGIQRNNTPVAVLVSWDTYRNLRRELDRRDLTLDDLGA